MIADGTDPSAAGFMSIFGSDAEAPTDTQIDTEHAEEATAADASAPEETDDGQPLSAEDLVAARFAAEMAAAGAEETDVGEDDEVVEASDEDAFDPDSLTDEQKRANLEAFEALKAEQSASAEQAAFAAVQEKAAEAEAQAEAAVAQQFERDVLSTSEQHYNAELNQRIRDIVKLSRNQDDPDTFIIQNAIVAANTVWQYRQDWERNQARDWAQAVQDARIAARQNSPEVREYIAKHLVKKFNLPEAAVADIASQNRHILAFEQRAQELADIAATLGKERQKTAQLKRQDANRKLKQQPVRTSSTGRLPGGKPKDYKGTTDEFVALMRFGPGD